MQSSNRRIQIAVPPVNVQLPLTRLAFLRPRSHVKTRRSPSSRINCPQWHPPMWIIPRSMHRGLKEDSTSRFPGRREATSTAANAGRRLAEDKGLAEDKHLEQPE